MCVTLPMNIWGGIQLSLIASFGQSGGETLYRLKQVTQQVSASDRMEFDWIWRFRTTILWISDNIHVYKRFLYVYEYIHTHRYDEIVVGALNYIIQITDYLIKHLISLNLNSLLYILCFSYFFNLFEKLFRRFIIRI